MESNILSIYVIIFEQSLKVNEVITYENWQFVFSLK